ALVGAARRAVGRGLVVEIAEAAVAALQQALALARLGEIEQHLAGLVVDHLGAGGHTQHHVLGVGAGLLSALAVVALPRLEVLLVAVVDQRVESVDAFEDHVAAAATIAAVRAAELDVLLAPERAGAGAAVAALEIDLGLVEEFHRKTRPEMRT